MVQRSTDPTIQRGMSVVGGDNIRLTASNSGGVFQVNEGNPNVRAQLQNQLGMQREQQKFQKEVMNPHASYMQDRQYGFQQGLQSSASQDAQKLQADRLKQQEAEFGRRLEFEKLQQAFAEEIGRGKLGVERDLAGLQVRRQGYREGLGDYLKQQYGSVGGDEPALAPIPQVSTGPIYSDAFMQQQRNQERSRAGLDSAAALRDLGSAFGAAGIDPGSAAARSTAARLAGSARSAAEDRALQAMQQSMLQNAEYLQGGQIANMQGTNEANQNLIRRYGVTRGSRDSLLQALASLAS